MKVLSMDQPHALLTVHGYKTIETRATDTTHRGWLAIHATKEWQPEHRAMVGTWPANKCLDLIERERYFDRAWPRFGYREYGEEALPKGAIVGLVYLATTDKTDGLTERWNRQENVWSDKEPDYNNVTMWEPSFGDYRKGRRAWWFAYPIAFQRPIAVDGFPGIWSTDIAALRDGKSSCHVAGYDPYDDAIYKELYEQHITLPDEHDPAFYRLIQRRGVTAGVPTNI